MSGMKQMVINTQERAISTDINRLQKFKEQDLGELLRQWLDVKGSDDLTSGQTTEPNTVEDPLRAEIVGGLLAKPQTGSTDVFIDPGVLAVMAPDGALDESNYKYVRDPGTTTPGALTIAAGGGGAIRIDVIECRINAVDKIVTDNRDIFNTTTGLFSASSVTKERSAQLEYRVRQGTAGAGFPGTASGWLPLCVASVPAAATNNDGCAFWDVRPLLAHREYGGFNLSRDEIARYDGRASTTATAGRLAGFIELVNLHGRRVGGRLRSTSPLADAEYIDWRGTENYDTGVAAGNPATFGYFATPFGLPNWARYTTSGARLPRSPRGLIIISATGPTAHGVPTAALALPPATGLGGTTSDAVCFYMGKGGGGAQHPSSTANRVQLFGLTISTQIAGANLAPGQADFAPVPNTHFPQNAKALYVELAVARTVAAGAEEDLQAGTLNWFVAGVNTNPLVSAVLPPAVLANPTGGPLAFNYTTQMIRLPVPTEYPANLTTPMLIEARWNGGPNPATPDVANLLVRGWEF